MSLYKLTITGGQRTDGRKKRLIGARAFALPKNQNEVLGQQILKLKIFSKKTKHKQIQMNNMMCFPCQGFRIDRM